MHRRLRQLSIPRGSRLQPSPATKRCALLVLVLGSSSGCAPELVDTSSGGPVARNAQPVLGGTLGERESVVFIMSEGPSVTSVCSGTLVAP
jgi:hypothetical protein